MGTLARAKRFSFRQRVAVGMLLFVFLLWMASCDSDTKTAAPAGQTPIETASVVGGSGTQIAGNVATATPIPLAVSPTATPTPAPVATPTVAGNAGVNTQDVPNLPNSQPADVGSPLQQRFSSQLLTNGASSSSIRFFTTSSSFEDVVKFYDQALANAGYRKQGEQRVTSIANLRVPDGAIVGYSQDSKMVAIVNAGIVNDNFIAQLNTAELTAENLKMGDRLIIVLENVPVGLG